MQYVAFERGIEVNGQTVYSVVDGFKLNRKIPSRILLAAGIGTAGPDGVVVVQPDAWYPQDAWLKAFEQIAADVGDSVLFNIGLAIPENAIFPPWIKTVDDAVRSIDVAYHLNHRKGGTVMFNPETGTMLEGIGHYGFQRAEGKRIIAECANPYPCSFDRGIVTAMARRFEPAAVIHHDENRPCRRKGADSCTYVVTW